MTKFYIYIEGGGEGCDYTIGCNVRLVGLNANTREKAIAEARDYYLENEGEIPYERMILMSHEKELPVGMWKREREDRNEQEFIDEEREKDEAEYQRLREKLGK